MRIEYVLSNNFVSILFAVPGQEHLSFKKKDKYG